MNKKIVGFVATALAALLLGGIGGYFIRGTEPVRAQAKGQTYLLLDGEHQPIRRLGKIMPVPLYDSPNGMQIGLAPGLTDVAVYCYDDDKGVRSFLVRVTDGANQVYFGRFAFVHAADVMHQPWARKCT